MEEQKPLKITLRPIEPKLKKIKLTLGDSQVTRDCTKLLGLVCEHTVRGRVLSEPFYALVPRDEYPDYYLFIKNPVSISCVEKRLLKYVSVDQFKDDVLTIFANCKSYNTAKSQIYLDAVELERFFLFQVAELLDPTDPLIQAVLDANIDQLEALVTLENVNKLYSAHMFGIRFTWSPVHVAAFHGHLKTLEFLIEKGGNIELQDTWYQGVF